MAGRIRAGLWRRVAHPWPAAGVAATRAAVLPATLIFVLALAPRLAWVLSPGIAGAWDGHYEAPSASADPQLGGDATYYLQTGRSLAEGKGYVEPVAGTPTARAPPGWPAILSVFYLLFGANSLPPQVFNALVGAATCALTYVLGSRLFGQKVGLRAGVILALFPGDILWPSFLLTEGIFTFILVVVLLFASGTVSGWGTFGLGLMAGGATMVRTEGLFLPLVFFVILLARGTSLSSSYRPIAIVLYGMAVFVVPWAARNTLQFDAPVFVTTRTGITLMVGHGEGAHGGPALKQFFALAAEYRALPEPERSLEMDRAAWAEARDEFLSDPLGDLALIPHKIRWLYQHDTTWNHAATIALLGGGGPLSYTQIRNTGEAYYYFVLAGAVLTLVLRNPAAQRGGYALLFGPIAVWSFMFGFVFFGDARYHIPLLPIFSILAASGYGMLLHDARGWLRTRLR